MFVVAKDIDVLVIIVHAYAIARPSSRWYMKIDHEKFVDIGKIYDCLDEMYQRYYHTCMLFLVVTQLLSFLELEK